MNLHMQTSRSLNQQTTSARFITHWYTQESVHACVPETESNEKGAGGVCLMDETGGPWRLSSPQMEALEERLGAVLLIQVGLIMPVFPLPRPSHRYIRSGRKRMIKEDKEGEDWVGGGNVCACNLWPSLQSSISSGDSRDFPFALLVLLSGTESSCCSTFTPQPAFVEAALGLINTQTIWQMLSNGSGAVPRSNAAFCN